MRDQSRQAHWEGVYTKKGESEVSWFQESPADPERTSRGELYPLLQLRELSQDPLGRPPYQPDSTEDDHGQTNPSKYADGDEPRT